MQKYQTNPKVAALDSIMKSPKLSALMKEAIASGYGHPSRVKAKKLFDATSAASNNYFADGQGGVFDGSTGYFGNPFSSQQQGTAPMTTPTFTPPMPTGSATSIMMSSPMSAVSAKKAEMEKAKSLSGLDVYRGGYKTPNYEDLGSMVGRSWLNLSSWLGNLGIDAAQWAQNNPSNRPDPSLSGGISNLYAVTNRNQMVSRAFNKSPSSQAPGQIPTSGKRVSTPANANFSSASGQEMYMPPPIITKEQAMAFANSIGPDGASHIDGALGLGMSPDSISGSIMNVTPEQLYQQMMNRIFNPDQGATSNLPGGSSLEAMAKSAPGINTFIQQAMPEMNKMFASVPEDQRPYGVADLGQIPVLNETLRKELDLDNQLKRIRTMQSNNSNIEGDLRDYIKGKDQNLKNVDSMLDKAKVDMLNLDLSDPHTAKRAQSYMDYLNTLKTRTETRYNDFLTESADIYQKRLDSNIGLYNDSLSKYQELFTQGSNVIRDNYQIAVGYLTDMYNSAQNAGNNSLQTLTNQMAAAAQAIELLKAQKAYFGGEDGSAFNQEYNDNKEDYVEVYKRPQYRDTMRMTDENGKDLEIEVFKGSIDDAMAGSSAVGLDPKGGIIQYADTMSQNFLDAKYSEVGKENLINYYAPILGDFIAAHAKDTTNAEFYDTITKMLRTVLQENAEPIADKADPEKVRRAIIELTSNPGSDEFLDAWLKKYGTPGSQDYVGKFIADAILAYYGEKADSAKLTQVYTDPSKYFSDFFDDARPGMQYDSINQVPTDIIKNELMPRVVDSYFYTLGYR